MLEQISFRPPAGTRARLEALRHPDESLVGVMLRAIEALEQIQGPKTTSDTGERPPSVLERLALLEAAMEEIRGKVAGLGGSQAPNRQPGSGEPGTWTRFIDRHPDLVDDVP